MLKVISPIRTKGSAALAEWTSAMLEAESMPFSNAAKLPLRPLQVTWEMTQACEWKTSSTRAAARREPDRFSTAEAFHLIDQVAAMHVPLLALTGGDPLTRADLFPVIEYASRRSVRTSLTLLPTPLLDAESIAALKASGLMRAGFWLHGSTAALDDSYRGLPGSHKRTLEVIGACHEAQLPVQINTIIARRNFHDIDPLIELLTRLDVSLWNVFFFVPPSREPTGELLTADEHEDVFAKLYAASSVIHFQIKTTEGPHYQCYLLQQRARESRGRISDDNIITGVPNRVNEGRGFVFINHQGQVYPSRFLPLSAGNVMNTPLAEVYGESPLFVSLRDSSRLKGKCGRCPVRHVCGGSRARAYAMTGDLFAADPACAYQP
ncbi:MAG TPA: radical SAM protein [Candidatus Sulfotelmatobacter sp.]|jgi:radical SAM protein with 4Fe4S-binding SPASM domain|nr:radical SAM protein [Candidatus Sulfotelmatobacter sp.]